MESSAFSSALEVPPSARSTQSKKPLHSVMETNIIWAALVINFLLVYIVPSLIKKPTGIQIVDDVVLYLNSQKGFLLASSIVLAGVIYGAHYWVGSSGPSSPDF
jgi:hypothetical protein